MTAPANLEGSSWGFYFLDPPRGLGHLQTCCSRSKIGVSQNYRYLFGVPILRLIIFRGLYWGPLFWENYQITNAEATLDIAPLAPTIAPMIDCYWVGGVPKQDVTNISTAASGRRAKQRVTTVSIVVIAMSDGNTTYKQM